MKLPNRLGCINQGHKTTKIGQKLKKQSHGSGKGTTKAWNNFCQCIFKQDNSNYFVKAPMSSKEDCTALRCVVLPGYKSGQFLVSGSVSCFLG